MYIFNYKKFFLNYPLILSVVTTVLWLIGFSVYLWNHFSGYNSPGYDFGFYFITFNLVALIFELKILKSNDAIPVLMLSIMGGSFLAAIFGSLNSLPSIIDYILCFSMCWAALFLAR